MNPFFLLKLRNANKESDYNENQVEVASSQRLSIPDLSSWQAQFARRAFQSRSKISLESDNVEDETNSALETVLELFRTKRHFDEEPRTEREYNSTLQEILQEALAIMKEDE